MVPPRRQTIDTEDRVRSLPGRRQGNVSDDVSEAQYSTTTTNTLAGFLGKKKSHRDIVESERVSRLRTQREEARAAINALNQFIFVAGHTFKGRQLNQKDQKRLCEAAEQVGLSLEVVQALVQQTSNKNAVLNYCMASDDAFARKMKNDPKLSKLLEEDGKRDSGGKFDIAGSVWRIFMHKIVQQFLREHDLELSDVMSKESLTSRLYEEALRNETKNSSNDFGNDQAEFARMQRDYTKERERLTIPEEEAKLARQQAEANMNYPVHPEYGGLILSERRDYIVSKDQTIVTDDILSLRLGDNPSDDASNTDHDFRENRVPRRQSAPMPTRRKPVASDGEEEVSAVKRGLAVFGKPQDCSQDSVKRRRRTSLAALEESKVSSSRARFEVGLDDLGSRHPETVRKQRHSLAVLQESKIVNSKARAEGNPKEAESSMESRTATGKTAWTPTVKKLNPQVKQLFERGSLEGPKPDSTPGADIVNRSSVGSFVKSTKQLFEGASHFGETSEGESKPDRPRRTTASRRNRQQGTEELEVLYSSKDRVSEVETLPEIDGLACDNSVMTSEGYGVDVLPGKRPNLVVVHANSEDSNGVYSSLTQSSSSSQEEGKSKSPRQPVRGASRKQSRSSMQKSETVSSASHFNRRSMDDIDSKSPKAPWRRDVATGDGTEHQPSNSHRTGNSSIAAAITPHSTTSGAPFASGSLQTRNGRNESDKTTPAPFGGLRYATLSTTSSTHLSSLHSSKGVAMSRPSLTAPTVVTNVTSFSDSRQDIRSAIQTDAYKLRDVDTRQKREKWAPARSSERPDPIFSSYEDDDEGWVDFGRDFVGRPGSGSLGGRSGRGLTEDDNDSLRQPGGGHFILSTSEMGGHLNRTVQHQQTSSKEDANDALKISQRVDDWSKKVRTLLSDDEQPETPGPHKIAQAKASKEKTSAVRAKHPGTLSDKENIARQDPKGEWIKFQVNPFQYTNEEHSDLPVPESYDSERRWHMEGPNPASTSADSDFLSTEGGKTNRSNALTDQAEDSWSVEKPGFGKFHQISDTSVVVRTMNVRDSLDQYNRLQASSNARDSMEQYKSRGAKAIGHDSGLYQQAQGSNLDGAFRRSKGLSKQSFDGSSFGLYGNTEPTRSMSSESDFDAVNAYNETDKQRIERMGASSSTSNPQGERCSHAAYAQQPEAPLVSKRGSRASDVMATQSHSSTSRYPEVFTAPAHAMTMSIREQGTGDSSFGLNSFPNSTFTSQHELISQTTIYLSHDYDDERQPMVNCQVEPSRTCQLNKQACVIGGLPILETSYQHMDGGPPSMNPVAGSESFAPDYTSQEVGSQVNQHARMAMAHYASQQDPDMEALNSYRESYEYKRMKRRSSMPPNTPTGLTRPAFASNSMGVRKSLSSTVPSQIRDQYGVDAKNSSSSLSDGIHEDTSPGEDEARDDYNYHQCHASAMDSRDRYLDAQPGFDESEQAPTSPTQLRSTDSESTVDEEDIRRAAERRGIDPELVEVIISQSNSKIRRAAPQGVETLPPLDSDGDGPYHDVPIDSDTCRPASARHLRKDVGPDSYSAYDQGTSWDAIDQYQQDQYADNNTYAPDPTPRQQAAILAALHESAQDVALNRRNSILAGIPDLPEGASEEELNLLNRFIEVAASNFDGKKLSADSEKRVRAAAEKVGLSQKFVDQLLEQANANNQAQQQQLQGLQNVSIPIEVDAVDDRDDASTYMTRSTRRAKKRIRDVGCNAWEQWDHLTNLVRGWTNCGAVGDVHHEDEDESSISSTEDRETRKRKEKNKSKRRKSQTERRGFV